MSNQYNIGQHLIFQHGKYSDIENVALVLVLKPITKGVWDRIAQKAILPETDERWSGEFSVSLFVQKLEHYGYIKELESTDVDCGDYTEQPSFPKD